LRYWVRNSWLAEMDTTEKKMLTNLPVSPSSWNRNNASSSTLQNTEVNHPPVEGNSWQLTYKCQDTRSNATSLLLNLKAWKGLVIKCSFHAQSRYVMRWHTSRKRNNSELLQRVTLWHIGVVTNVESKQNHWDADSPTWRARHFINSKDKTHFDTNDINKYNAPLSAVILSSWQS
jgi:hypothetical protein